MSLAHPPLQERRPSGGNTTTLSSNNPFRRAVSPSTAPAAPSSSLPTYAIGGGQVQQQASTNPFLDSYQPSYPANSQARRQRSPAKAMLPTPRHNESARQAPAVGSSAELISGLNLSDKPVLDRKYQPRGPPPSSRVPPISNHRSTRSQDGARRGPSQSRKSGDEPLNVFATPPKQHEVRQTRRNSDSSVMESKDEERKKREQRHKDRDQSKSRPSRSSKPKKPHQHMDIIDKLDVTGIYGTGLFHHDGPFDACIPQRNRIDAKTAPMKAFAEGSANNSMGGSGPVNKVLDLDKFHGRVPEGFNDFNPAAASNEEFKRPNRLQRPGQPEVIDPKGHAEHIYGEETAGLGTTTFLEGAPAPTSKVTRQQGSSENEAYSMAGPGLHRKKSLAQKIRGMSKQRPQELNDGGRVVSPEARYYYAEGERSRRSPPALPPLPMFNGANGNFNTTHVPGPQSAGGRGRMVDVNPFEFESQVEKKKLTSVNVADAGESSAAGPGRNRTMSSPQQRPLFRMKTNDSIGSEVENKNSGGGLLNRVRSMRGGRRLKTDRRES